MIWGNSVRNYLWVIAGIVFARIILQLFAKKLFIRLRRIAKKTHTSYDDILLDVFEKFGIIWLYLFINYQLISFLNLSPKTENILAAAFMVVSCYYIVSIFNFFLHNSVVSLLKKKNEPEHRIRQIDGMLVVVKALAWITGFILLADNLGYNVATIIAGLGVGGIAIALAAQSILSNLFSYIVIFFDKPFEIGDFIIMGNYSGIVEKIGIKTTHVRSLDGQQLVMPNAEMAKSVIQNYKRLQRRRIVFKLGVVYNTKADRLRAIPAIVKDIITKMPQVDFDRAHLQSFGDFSINFEVVYYLNAADYNLYMDTQQSICIGIFESFEKSSIDFAYPTQTIFLSDSTAKKDVKDLHTLHEFSNGK